MPIDDYPTGGFAKEDSRARGTAPSTTTKSSRRSKKGEASKPAADPVVERAVDVDTITIEPVSLTSTNGGERDALIDVASSSLPRSTTDVRQDPRPLPQSQTSTTSKLSNSRPQVPPSELIGGLTVSSPPRDLYHYGQYPMPSSPRGNSNHFRATSDTYTPAASPTPSYAQPLWSLTPDPKINGSLSYRAASLGGSPPNVHMTGQSPPSYAPHPYARPMSGHSFPAFQQAYHQGAQYEITPPAPPLFCSLDTLSIQDAESSYQQVAVVLVAKAPDLEVYRAKDDRLEILGALKDVTGQVLDAKILPGAGRDDPFFPVRPLIAIVVHTSQNAPEFQDNAALPVPADPQTEHGPSLFRTRVEVHSLATGQYIGFLYESDPSPREAPSWPLGPATSPPVGELQIQACGKFVVVASGSSGEVFCFTHSDNDAIATEKFRCIAKFWTTVRRKSPSDPAQQQCPGKPIFSLGPRWLCIVPPGSKSKPTISGRVPLATPDAKPFGVESVNAPMLPSVDSELDVPNQDGFANKVARGVAQEVFKGAKWVGSQGVSAWNNYFNKSQPSSEQVNNPQPQPKRHQDLSFPPTHAGDEVFASPNIPSVVSIIDLEQLLRASTKPRIAAEPFITFEIPGGCNFLSFAPSGIRLMTASENGDTQAIWGLMTAHPSKALASSNTANKDKPSVIQLAKFTRFTPADIVDVAWSAPKEDNLAVLTERGTVHIFKLPSTIFAWPKIPSRRKSFPQLTPMIKEAAQEPFPDLSSNQLPMKPEGILGSAAAMVRKRSSSSGITTLFSGISNLHISAASSLREGRKVYEGMGRTASAAAEALRHADEDRLRLNTGHGAPQIKSLCFTPDSEYRRIAAISNNVIKFHDLPFGNKKPAADKDSPIPLRPAMGTDALQKSFWRPKTSIRRDTNLVSDDVEAAIHPLACAEIDSAPSYQPFFCDRRFTASTYSPDRSTNDPWTFGTDISNQIVRTKPPRVATPQPQPQADLHPPSNETHKEPSMAVASTPPKTSHSRKSKSKVVVSDLPSPPAPIPMFPTHAQPSEVLQDEVLQNDGLDDEALIEHMAKDEDIDFSSWDVDNDDLLR